MTQFVYLAKKINLCAQIEKKKNRTKTSMDIVILLESHTTHAGKDNRFSTCDVVCSLPLVLNF